jgi:hypothetical protein
MGRIGDNSDANGQVWSMTAQFEPGRVRRHSYRLRWSDLDAAALAFAREKMPVFVWNDESLVNGVTG